MDTEINSNLNKITIFTPTIYKDGSGLGDIVDAISRKSYYYKIGKMVFIHISCTVEDAFNYFKIQIPFTAKTDAALSVYPAQNCYITGNTNNVTIYIREKYTGLIMVNGFFTID